MVRKNEGMLAEQGGLPLAPSREPVQVGDDEARGAPTSHSDELCPICLQAGTQVWVQAPDRFHGRQENYTLLRCLSCS